MSKLSLGTAQFGLTYGIANQSGQVPKNEAIQILDLLKKRGIGSLDTAMTYGESELVLGSIGVDEFDVITKLPKLPSGILNINDWVDSQISSALVRMNLNSVYGILLHDPQDLLREEGRLLTRSLANQKSRGVASKVGVSIYDPDDLAWITNLMDVDIIQAPLNLIDRRLERSGWLNKLYSNGVEIYTRSAFLQGLLLMTMENIPNKFSPWMNLFRSWHRLLREKNLDPAEVCLSYPLSLPEVNRVVVGVDGLAQFQQLLNYLESRFNEDDWGFMVCEDERLINPSMWENL